MSKNKLYIVSLILLASVIGGFITSCSPSCDKVCHVRTNFKDGDNFSDEYGFGEFDRKGSPPLCDRDIVWPSFTLLFKGVALVENTGQALDNKGLSPWFRLKRCLTMSEVKMLMDPEYGSHLLVASSGGLTHNTFLVRDTKGLCGHGGCIVYGYDLSPENLRVTFDEEQCGINVDIIAKPLMFGNHYFCKKCKC